MCTFLFTVTSALFTVMVIILFITVLYGCYKIIINHKTERISKKSKLLRFIFLFASLITIGYYPYFRWRTCIKTNFNIYLLDPIWDLFYGIQVISLSILFFNTIIVVFNNSSFQISKCKQIIYKIIFIFAAICIILFAISTFYIFINYYIFIIIIYFSYDIINNFIYK